MADLALAREIPRPLPGIPLWSETYAFVFFDPQDEVGVWLHCGRFPDRPELWRTMFTVFLPDGQRFVGKNYECGDESEGPAGRISRLTCGAPFRRWDWRYGGPARATTVDRLAAGALADGSQDGLEADLTFTARGPVWDMSSADIEDQDWASEHVQQLGTVKGAITIGDAAEIDFEGVGWRDHSSGTRDMDTLAGHSLVSGYLPDRDLGFMLFDLHLKDGSVTRTGLITRGELTAPAQGVELARLTEIDAPLAPYSFALPVDGETLTVEAEVLHATPLTMIPPNHAALGALDEPGALVLWESHVRFRLGDSVGYGYTERSLTRPR